MFIIVKCGYRSTFPFFTIFVSTSIAKFTHYVWINKEFKV